MVKHDQKLQLYLFTYLNKICFGTNITSCTEGKIQTSCICCAVIVIETILYFDYPWILDKDVYK